MTLEVTAPAQLGFRDVTIGILTALDEEYAACTEILDPGGRQGVFRQTRATTGTLTCHLCPVASKHGGTHTVAIMRLVNMGNTAAAIGANILLQHCPSLRFLIMCGIAGAVPNPDSPADHVRLGDIVVSDKQGIFQYDFGKQRDPGHAPDDPFAGFDFRSLSRSPSPELLEVVARIQSMELHLHPRELREWEKALNDFLQRSRNASAWKRPGVRTDRLIDTRDGSGSPINHPIDTRRRRGRPRVFRGPIGAANIVLADPRKRDALRNRFGIRAVEMEGYGVADAAWVAQIGFLVIRGTCDYCNSSKNDDWHNYAALAAASYALTVVTNLHANGPEVLEPPGTIPVPSDLVPMPSVGDSEPTGTKAVLSEAPSVESGSSSTARATSRPINLQRENTPVTTKSTEALERLIQPPPISTAEERDLRSIVAQLVELVSVGNWRKADPLATLLETKLRQFPRRGEAVRAGWLLLGNIESRRLLADKQAGKAIDASRLRQIRQEAESVID